MHNLISKMARLEALCKSVFDAKLTPEGNLQRYPHLPKMPDCQIIALSIVAETEAVKSENHLFASLKEHHPGLMLTLPCRQSYNRRVKRLRDWIDELACHLSDEMMAPLDTLIVDSTKYPVCRFIRAPRVKICQEQADLQPAFGYSASDKTRYFGFKFHMACTQKGVVANYFITPANESDVTHVVNLIGSLRGPCQALGDKGYISRAIQLDLFENHQVKLETDLRRNQRNFSTWSDGKAAQRLRIETTFSQLIDQFHFRRNYAKTTRGLFTRISTKIAAFTLMQYANFSAGLPLSKLQNSFAF